MVHRLPSESFKMFAEDVRSPEVDIWYGMCCHVGMFYSLVCCIYLHVHADFSFKVIVLRWLVGGYLHLYDQLNGS